MGPGPSLEFISGREHISPIDTRGEQPMSQPLLDPICSSIRPFNVRFWITRTHRRRGANVGNCVGFRMPAQAAACPPARDRRRKASRERKPRDADPAMVGSRDAMAICRKTGASGSLYQIGQRTRCRETHAFDPEWRPTRGRFDGRTALGGISPPRRRLPHRTRRASASI
jgi:hypothetical protein